MARTLRKQTHQDFRRRIKSVDPTFYRNGERGAMKDATAQRPIGSALLGFGWAYLVISVANNRTVIEQSLHQGNLHTDYHGYVLMALAALLAASGVMLLLHLVRYFTKTGGKKRNSGGLLVGALGALVLVYTPTSVWDAGFDMMDGNSRSFVQTASATMSGAIPSIDLGSVAFVSSQGR
ncbi:hypothetical protein [Tropicibacter oceani]|uniref:Uncharacterized protein n=1 Tax=Tropicibacter oceani TaxID=3058420 RepID=A0ABY8QFY6_9RHOB|nr:hypothetical protein [Tropicibacter oceani]WGW02933.1 hypothetical protein QF118_13455 [Tropicibacter oceani]